MTERTYSQKELTDAFRSSIENRVNGFIYFENIIPRNLII
ncbi:hypothetical protein SAMN02194393_04276 [Maledivibacter halophilus]|uniref:Uncharacterized protein n=1 Tax=Maledivibacter halophilus TaxID=36842 RepID=A0A1T5M9R2_9FIRM|nr:hypothetical protein SAMN02194393_04276 [Maledivibacter halophilus]